MKKYLSIILVIVLSAMSIVGCGKSSESSEKSDEPRLIGVAMNTDNAGDKELMDYLNKEIGPALNLKFDFSEAIADTEALVTFIENERSKGAVGIINQQPNGSEQGAALCDEYGMYIVNIESAMKETIMDMKFNAGSIGASVEGIANVYGEAIRNIIGDGKEHSIIVFSGAASYGAQSHVYSASAILEAFQEQYGLTYEEDIKKLATTSKVGEISTGNDKIKIYMVPGTNPTEAASTVSTQLQTGNYDIFMAVFAYSAFTGYVSEVETALGMDVKVLATAPIKEDTTKGFTTLDPNGNSTLNSAILNPIYEQTGMGALMLYNALDGKADLLKENGKAQQFYVNQWLCEDAETYTNIMKLNKPDTYVLSGDGLLKLTGDKAGIDSINAKLEEITDINSVIADILK